MGRYEALPSRSARMPVTVWSPYPLVRRGIEALLSDMPHRFLLISLPAGAAPLLPEHTVIYDVHDLLTSPTFDLEQMLLRGGTVVALGDPARPQLAASATARGAAGYVWWTTDGAELAAALEAASLSRQPHVRERAPVDEPERTTDWDVVRSGVLHSSGVSLTARQVQILDGIASGLTNTQIAAQLFLSVNTVKTHTRAVYGLLGVRSRVDAGTWALRRGLGPHARPLPPAGWAGPAAARPRSRWRQ